MKFVKIPSPNFDKIQARPLKYIIIHYTGMNSQKDAIKKLQSRVAKVSTHYLISKKGVIYQMVKDHHVAWHAGKSRWGNDKNLNLKSIGIELVNKGDEKFPFLQIKSLCILIKYLKNKHKIQKKTRSWSFSYCSRKKD